MTALPPPAALLVVGAGGTLGSAVLAEALAAGTFAPAQALAAEPVRSALRCFEPLPLAALAAGAAAVAATAVGVAPTAVQVAPTAVLVFERARHSNGRDDAFVQPEAAELLPLARTLQACGVRRLLVVASHAPALLPQALKQGLASLDEGAVAALGFEQLVFVRAAQDRATAAQAGLPERFAGWWLSQLRWMVPQREQPLRAAVLARIVVRLAQLLPAAAPGTRVLPPELLWQAAQPAPGAEAVLARWLQLDRRP